VIEQLTGVGFHPGHVWRLLRRLGWSVQRPARRAAERDEAEIACPGSRADVVRGTG
jgi:transposase